MLGNGFPCNALTTRGRALLDVESLILWGKNGGNNHTLKRILESKMQFEPSWKGHNLNLNKLQWLGTFISHLQTIFSLSIPGSNIYRMPETWRFWHFKGSPRSQLVVFSIPSTFEVQTSKAVGSHKPKNNRMWTWETYDFLKQAWMGLPGMPLGYANLQLYLEKFASLVHGNFYV